MFRAAHWLLFTHPLHRPAQPNEHRPERCARYPDSGPPQPRRAVLFRAKIYSIRAVWLDY